MESSYVQRQGQSRRFMMEEQDYDGATAKSMSFKTRNKIKNCLSSLSSVAVVALIIIGALGVTGYIAPSTLGWTALGLSGLRVVQQIVKYSLIRKHLEPKELKKERIHLFVSIAFSVALATIGIMGGIGFLGASQVAWGIIGSSLSYMTVSVLCCSYCSDAWKKGYKRGYNQGVQNFNQAHFSSQ